jgi:hypothetical protein
MNSDGVDVQLYGGPNDGRVVKIEKHTWEIKTPRATPHEIRLIEPIHDELARCYVNVYKRNAKTGRYEFSGVDVL